MLRNNMLKKPKSSILLVVLVAFIIDFSLKNWQKEDRIIEHDIHNYYAYLPLIFIYDDIRIEKGNYKQENDLYWFWPIKTEAGKNLIKGSIGMTYMYAPFFFVAHYIAPLFDCPADGFSQPYKLFLLLSALFYLWLGLLFLSKTLSLLAYDEKTIFITILLLGLGTNLLAYSSQSATMPHVFNFSLISIFLFYAIKWHEKQHLKFVLILGVIFGLITLIRPTNGLVVFFFLFYEVFNFNDVKEKLRKIKKNIFQLLLIFPIVAIVWVPQFWYWKIITGDYLYYSYGEEGFYFLSPKIVEGLFSFRKGWLIYTPIMIFALLGLFIKRKDVKKTNVGIIFFVVLNIYIVFSWWCWWYGGTFGQRAIIDSYAILAIPFAGFIVWINEKKTFLKTIFLSVSIFFIWLNIFQTYQFENQSLHHDSMSKELYFKQFGKLDKIMDFDKYLDGIDYQKELTRDNENFKIEGLSDEDILVEKHTIQLIAKNGKYIICNMNRGDSLIANSDNPWEWETFTLLIFEKGDCALLSSEKLFVSFDDNGLTAIRKDKKARESFQIVPLKDDVYAFKANNNKFLTYDKKSFKLMVSSEKIGDLEKFKIVGYK